MINILLRVLIGIVVGAAGVGTALLLSKSNIVEKIKSAFLQKRATKHTNESNEAFAAYVKEKQKDSVNVEVFFETNGNAEVEEVSIHADKVADDIIEGEIISLVE